MKKRANKEEMLRARCLPSLKQEVAQVAMLQGLDESDIVRIACTRLVQQFKQPSLSQTGILVNA